MRTHGWGVGLGVAFALGGCGAKHVAPPAPWSVTLTEMDGASWCATSGDACVPADGGARAASGAFLRTSDVGRALATLDDETTAELGPGAAFTLADGDPRIVDIRSGVVIVRRSPHAPAPTGKYARVAVKVGTRIARLDAGVPTVLAVRAREGGDRSALSVDHGVVTINESPRLTELRAGDTVAVVKGQEVDRRALFTGMAARVEIPRQESASRGAPRGLGTMTARAPGTEEIVAGVRLASHHVRAIVQHGFARTEIEEVFANDTDRTLEGRYVFAVPTRAVTARLALWVGDKLVEDEVVEKKKAAAIFKNIVDDTVRPRDPALLEWVASGELSLKVFPIPPKGTRKVVLAYDEALVIAGDEVHYVYPLSLGEARANTIDDLAISVTVTDPEGAPLDVETPHYNATIARDAKTVTATFDAKSFAPTADFVLGWRTPKPSPIDAAAFVPAWGTPSDLGLDRTAKAAGTQSYGAVRLAIGFADGVGPPAFKKRDRVIAIDTSHSQSPETLAAQVKLAMAIARALEPDELVALLACDSACTSYPEKGLAIAVDATFTAAERWANALSPGGSSDVAGALLAAASRLDDVVGGQIIYVGDGVATSGELSPLQIARRAKPLLSQKKADLRFIGAGPTIDAATLSLLARELGATYQPLVTGQSLVRRIDALVASLRMPVVHAPTLKLPETMVDVYPRTLPNLVLGEELLVVARLTSGNDGLIDVTGELDGASWGNRYALSWGTASDHQAAVVPRMWAAQRIDDLILMHDPKSDKESIELSKRFHVLSRLTSMLVLENDAMFAAMGVKRTVAPDGTYNAQAAQAEQLQLQLLSVLGGSAAMPGNLNDLSSNNNGVGPSGGLRLGQGGGSIGLGGTGIPSQAPATGTRKAEIAVISVGASPPIANVNVVIAGGARARARGCYQRGLAQDPSLAGSVAFTLAVGPDGDVMNVTMAPNGNISGQVVACIQSVLRSLRFAAPEGGGATVRGSFRLTSVDAPAQPTQPPGMPSYTPPQPPTALTRASDDAWRSAGDDAIAKLRAASDASPQSRLKREAFVRGLLVRGRFEQAMTVARSFVEMDPDLPTARELLSYAAAAAGDTKTALLAVDAAVETNAASVKSHLRAARAFESAGDERRACAHWRSLVEIDASEEWRYESIRCRARALGDREGALADAHAIEKPGKLVEKLLPLLTSGEVPAFDPSSAAFGQMEVSVTCASGVVDCPIPLVVAPNGTVFSPLTPADARSTARMIAITVLRDGAYHTMLVGGGNDAKGGVVVRAGGVTQKFSFSHGGVQSVAISDVSVPPPWLASLGLGGRFAW